MSQLSASPRASLNAQSSVHKRKADIELRLVGAKGLSDQVAGA